ncbi:hypothetical protein [Lyticum sinuosum]|uniref:Uncharacterized protein n=1 Tax=Lyticum sinuosum TaxID=1332059 RepID=A0AAE5AI34_9RICK|nr:hypothetical protein [Lyticum sinuosum]MDZ5761569.1 hypothetical protein [Lyticum sinuosum]
MFLHFLRSAFIILIISIYVSGCVCKNSYMPTIDIVNPEDKFLSCEGLKVSIIQMKALMENVKIRCERPHLFSPYPPCTLWIKQDAAKNYHIIHDRIAYLKKLGDEQSCNIDYEISKCCESLGLNEIINNPKTIEDNFSSKDISISSIENTNNANYINLPDNK